MVRFIIFFFLMIRQPPRSTRPDTLFPYTTLFRSFACGIFGNVAPRGIDPGHHGNWLTQLEPNWRGRSSNIVKPQPAARSLPTAPLKSELRERSAVTYHWRTLASPEWPSFSPLATVGVGRSGTCGAGGRPVDARISFSSSDSRLDRKRTRL